MQPSAFSHFNGEIRSPIKKARHKDLCQTYSSLFQRDAKFSLAYMPSTDQLLVLAYNLICILGNDKLFVCRNRQHRNPGFIA